MDAFFVYIPCGFVISALGESCFPNSLTLAGLPQIAF